MNKECPNTNRSLESDVRSQSKAVRRKPLDVRPPRILLISNFKPGTGGISGQVEILQKKLRGEGMAADVFSTKGSVRYRIGMMFRLLARGRHYDVFHIHCCSGWGFLPAVVGVIVGRRLKKRIVLTYHGGGAESFFTKHCRMVRYFLLRTDANIVLSGFLGKVFDQIKVPYHVIPNIIELDGSKFRNRSIIRPSFVSIRTLDPLYNIPCILRAFQIVKVQYPDATLTIVGDGRCRSELVQMVAEMNLQDVIFTGRVDNSQIYYYLDRADIMLSAPHIDNMPVSVLEGFNAGILVISSNVGGVPYMIDDGVNGLLFKDDDSNELANKMLESIRNPEDTKVCIQNAHDCVKDYSWQNIKKKLYSLYQYEDTI